MLELETVNYSKLNARQKELFNFHKVAGRLIDYGYYSIRLSDDWQGADFLACRFNGDDFIKIQLKGKMTIDRKYRGKQIRIIFRHHEDYYVYPHDEVMEWILENKSVGSTESWRKQGLYHWPSPPEWALKLPEFQRI